MKLIRNIRDFLQRYLVALFVILALALGVSSQRSPRNPSDTRLIVRKIEHSLSKKTARLESLAAKALSQDAADWLEVEDLPEEFVIYRYSSDTLQSWCNEFPVFNDDIRVNPYMSVFINSRMNSFSPLVDVEQQYSFMSLAEKLFIVRSWQEGDNKVIAGIDLSSMPGADQYSFHPVSESCGTAVKIDGRPVFKVLCESLVRSKTTDITLFWIAIAILLVSALVFQMQNKTISRYRISALAILVGALLLYLWGMGAGGQMRLFSPLLYSGGRIFYSLGAIVVINIMILMESLSLFIVKDIVTRKIRPAVVAAILLIAVYTMLSLKDIILNSDISLEIYRLEDITEFSIITYISYISMLISLPMLFNVLGIDSFSRTSRILYPLIIAVGMVTAVGVTGFRKEQKKLEVRANRLAFDRDISLERRLKGIEPQISGDMIIASFTMFANTESSIQRRLAENYFFRNAREYMVDVYVFNEYSTDQQALDLYSSVLKNGIPIADNSHFMYVRNEGHSYYAGIFVYYVEGAGVARMLVRLETRDTLANKGYAGIFNFTPPGKTNVPPGYSFAHYAGEQLISFKGSYAYATKMDEVLYTMAYIDKQPVVNSKGYTHFVTLIGNNEAVILSRSRIPFFRYVIIGIFIALFVFFLMSVMGLAERKNIQFNIHNYKYKISAVLLLSLTMTLLVMAFVSVYFVYTRNEANMISVMSYKINSISNMMDAGLAMRPKNSDLTVIDLRAIMERAGDESNSDITLYNPSGRFFLSTSQMLFRRQLISGRISGSAYNQIVYGNRRYYLQKEKVGDKTFYCMYAPVTGKDGRLLAILCSPYYDENYDFQKDAAAHSLTIIALFLLLLLGARFLVFELVDRMFKPLSEMSEKMSNAGIDNLEQINYESDDEVSSIVQAYNRMVTELSESTRKLAQAERDKAWSGMARQVAHEIKNPLTPMKLQLQRVIRLKQKNDPAWMDRFEEASKIILDHIDILTDTANEFSTFAKLYSEEHTSFRLDDLLQEEITMFNNRDNIQIEYLGLDNVEIEGPKPQLTRVFVNLINNAVQALEASEDGQVRVSLRNSTDSGYYDILVEDNGSGVSEENQSKLFTPNFTTKNGGSGLGLAISRSILETCGATISYSKSFQLGGACFTIRYPKK